MTREEWRPIIGFEDRYEVSDLGRVRSVPRRVRCVSVSGREYQRPLKGVTLAQTVSTHGYRTVALSRDSNLKTCCIHALVAEAFLGPRPKGHQVAHGNGDRLDNRVENLRYATPSSNHLDKRDHGTMLRGDRHHQAKLTESQIPTIRALHGKHSSSYVASLYGVSPEAIQRIWRRTRWAHV